MRRHAGFTLIEVLVGLAVLSIGLAGIAALLLNGMRSTGMANLRSVAIGHSKAGVEMMRANLDAYMDGWYAGDNTSGDAPGTIDCVGASGCSQAEQANNDFDAWRGRIAVTLPNGVGFICTDSTPDDGQPDALACDDAGRNVTKIFWQDTRDTDTLDDGDTFQRYATMVNP
jgi:type IV pilus assembly protein PilV